MRMIMMLLTFAFCLLQSTVAFSAISNENSPGTECVALGSPAADALVLGMVSGKAMVVQSAYLVSAAGIAASNSDYAIIQIRKGATVVASLDTRAAGQGAVSANLAKAAVVVSAEKTIPAETVVSVNYDETDTGVAVALSGAIMCMTYAVK